MSNSAIVPAPSAVLASAEQLARAADAFAGASRSPNTLRAYASTWKAFVAWAAVYAVPTLPASPATVSAYLADLATSGRRAATIARAAAAISAQHHAAGYNRPTSSARVQQTLSGIRRNLGVAQTGKDPVLVRDLRAMVGKLPAGLLGIRDRALLTLGFSSACRRSELVALDLADLSFTAEGLELVIRRSKTDQLGAGRKVGIPYGSIPAVCPVRATGTWLATSDCKSGPVFRAVDRHGRLGERLGDRSVALVVKRLAEAAGLDPARFAGHSLRAGLVTSAAKAGKNELTIMKQTGHKSSTMVRRYIRDAALFDDNAASGLL